MKIWDKGFDNDPRIDAFTVGADRELDLLLAPFDIEGTIAHIRMLAKVGLLPAAEGREWRECDVDVGKDGRRGKNRLVWSNDGLYYLTRDKHKSFTEVKGE